MRRLRFYLIVSILAGALLPRQPLRGQAPSEGVGRPQASQARSRNAVNQPRPDQIGTKTRPLVVDAGGHINTPEETANAQKEADRTREIERRTLDATERAARYSYWTAWATWALVVVGLGGIVAAYFTLREIQKQTKATSDSVQALVNSERAWLTLSAISDDPPFEMPPGRVPVVFNLKNRGRTVARLTGPVKRVFVLLNDDERLPPTPAYDPRAHFEVEAEGIAHGLVIAPEDEQKGLWFSYKVPDGTMERIEYGSSRLYFTVSVTYFDFADKARELQFCYQYWPDSYYPKFGSGQRWQKTHAPDAYNKST
jgi:hypothetical protein